MSININQKLKNLCLAVVCFVFFYANQGLNPLKKTFIPKKKIILNFRVPPKPISEFDLKFPAILFLPLLKIIVLP